MKIVLAPPSRLDPDTARLVAKANCAHGIQLLTEEHYPGGWGPGLVAWIRDNVTSTPTQLSSEAAGLLRVAWQTELAARVSQFTGSVEVLRMGAHMLPVQAYYAVFNGLRALLAVAGNKSERHSQVQRTFSKNEARRMPMPWQATLTGDPEDVPSLRLAPSSFHPGTATTNPVYGSLPANEYLFSALRMARKWQFERARADVLRNAKTKAGKPRKNLNSALRQQALDRLWPTTLLDFLYGLRVRSNYMQADEYASDASDWNFQDFHSGILHLVDSALLAIESHIAVRVGTAAYEAEVRAWSTAVARAGAWAREPVESRCSAIQAYGGW